MPYFRSVALALLLLAPATASAQLLPEGTMERGTPRWSPIVSARLGWSLLDSSPTAGAQLRLPIPVPRLLPSITVGGDLVFQSGLTERQGTVDLTTGFLAPLYLGGGAATLNSIFEQNGVRETEIGWSLVAGLRAGRIGRLITDLEFRWVRVGELKPRYATLSLGYPLLGLLR